MPPKSAPLTQVVVRRMIKESVDAAIAAEQARHANAGNNASGSGPARGQVTAPVVRECTFARFMKCNPDHFCATEGAVELRRWFKKTEMTFGISECAEDKKVKFAAAILRGPNNQKQGNTRAMTTAPNEGKVSSGSLPVCERCFTRHVGQCTIKCHKCGKVGHKARSYEELMPKEGQARGSWRSSWQSLCD
ncbi:hypothetical protein Tco_1422974 [Tanacetum coccineum]